MGNIYRDELQDHFLLQVSSHFSVLHQQIRKEDENDLSAPGQEPASEQNRHSVSQQLDRHIWLLRADVLGCRCLEQMPAWLLCSGD